MGYKILETEVHLEPNEEKELNLELCFENRAAIHGVVKFPDKTPVKDAVVKLFIKEKNSDELIPVTFTYTDQSGQFLFGVESRIDYIIEVFYYQSEASRIKENDKDIFTDIGIDQNDYNSYVQSEPPFFTSAKGDSISE